jgi:hypothetical protein
MDDQRPVGTDTVELSVVSTVPIHDQDTSDADIEKRKFQSEVHNGCSEAKKHKFNSHSCTVKAAKLAEEADPAEEKVR